MRHRIEDLGRISVLVNNLLEHELFGDFNRWRRPKDAWQVFFDMSEDKKMDLINTFAYGIESLKDSIYVIAQIANGTDDLNDS